MAEDQMAEDRNHQDRCKAIVGRFWEALYAHDWEAIASFFARDATTPTQAQASPEAAPAARLRSPPGCGSGSNRSPGIGT